MNFTNSSQQDKYSSLCLLPLSLCKTFLDIHVHFYRLTPFVIIIIIFFYYYSALNYAVVYITRKHKSPTKTIISIPLVFIPKNICC